MQKLASIFCLAICYTFHIFAQTPVSTSDYSDSRTTTNGGVSGQNANNSQFVYNINWTISLNPNNTYHYLYSLTNLGNQASFFLELGSTSTVSNLSNVSINGAAITSAFTVANANEYGDTGILLTPTGSSGITTIAFDIAAAPIFGDFATGILSTSSTYYFNSGYGTTPAATQNFFATPGDVTTPEPGTFLLFGSMLALVGYKKYKKNKKVIV